jgi:hypothetical protein
MQAGGRRGIYPSLHKIDNAIGEHLGVDAKLFVVGKF